MPAANRRTQTVQFRVSDVTFYRGGLIMPSTAPLTVLMQADGVALKIDNQKNGTPGETVYQHALGGRNCCPLAALTRRVSNIMVITGDQEQPISRIATQELPAGHVTAKMIREKVRGAVAVLRLRRQGIKTDDVGSHSLQADCAMAMKLNGCNLITIMKSGQWTRLTFLTYIHNQSTHLGVNVYARMANPVPFFSF